MSARVEAAAKVLMLQSEGVELNDGYLKDATEVLAAADAVMFDDAAVERAAKAIHAETGLCWESMPEDVRQDRRNTARAVIAALKGDDK